ncbi:Rho termination factor N-terminal domain-containing protein [Paraclostridium sp. AKS46]|nr:Rho termination factor N-terminal domain-containing protein [Paraclostridium sp. AKS46]
MEVPQQIDYSEFKVDELKVIAKEKGLEGYSSMTKAELIKLIEG